MAQILFTDVRPHDVLVEDGRVVPPARRTEDCQVVAAGGLLALPAPVDAHVHPDKTTWGQPWLSRTPAATLRDLIEGDVAARAEMTAPVATRALALMDHAIDRGTRAWRAHVDVAPLYGLSNVHGVREAAQARAGLLDVQIVAFPQLGLLSRPGTAELMEQSLKEGADVLGGLDPVGIDGDLHGHLDLLYGMAERHTVPLDIHLHDGGEQGVTQVLEIARRARSSGVPTTISHAFCLADRADLAETLAEANISLTTCALGADPVLPVGPLVEAGVLVGLGSDGVRDPWTPFGDGDMINRAHLLAYRTDARTDEELATCYEIAAHGGAALLGLEQARLQPGDPADFLLVRAESMAQAVVDKPIPQLVVRNGRVRERSS
ncbi:MULTISPECIES: amidohydrolase family protein [unclassified Nonomuraea]|uniref:amidohydrolase family protein n=1 Tax=unclassified Nonomuraea TaxID=2593643 RepID=UPI0034028CD3